MASNRQTSSQSFLKDYLLDYNPQIGSDKILYFFFRLAINFFFINMKLHKSIL